jgi:ubiquitin conjugation factor E4 B
MTLLAKIKPIASIMPDLQNWIPEQTTLSGAIIEQSSLLGHLFALSPLSFGVPQILFKDLPIMSQEEQESQLTSIREEIQAYQKQLHTICYAIVCSSHKGRRGVLDWLSAALSWNKKRLAIQVDAATVASDAFMCNVVGVLNHFTKPFLDDQHSKVRIRKGHV